MQLIVPSLQWSLLQTAICAQQADGAVVLAKRTNIDNQGSMRPLKQRIRVREEARQNTRDSCLHEVEMRIVCVLAHRHSSFLRVFSKTGSTLNRRPGSKACQIASLNRYPRAGLFPVDAPDDAIQKYQDL